MSQDDEDTYRISRRDLLKLAGTSLALALAPGCVRKPPRNVVSRETAPEYRKPGIPLYYASTWTEGRDPYGLLVKTLDGRPVKVEGNPDHPLNRGTSTAAMQAALLSLYDPARLRAPHGAASWDEADRRVVEALEHARHAVVLTRATLGPSERAVLARFLARWPAAQALVFEPAADQPRRAAWRKVYRTEGEWRPRYDRAAVILAIGADFLATDGVVLEAARAFANGRQPDDANPARTQSNRLYVAEGDLSLTGMNADHHLRLRPSAYAAFLRALRGRGDGLVTFATANGLDANVLEALARDLKAHPNESLVVAGGGLPEAVHAEAALLNASLGAPGRTQDWNPAPVAAVPTDPRELAAAVDAADVVLAFGVNPVHAWPGGGFEERLRRVPLSVAHSLRLDETAAACTLALPSHHNLESWADAAPLPGVASLCQPALRPLFDSRQEAVSLMTWAGMDRDDLDERPARPSFRAFVKGRFERDVLGSLPWEEALRHGVVVAAVESHPAPDLDAATAESLAAIAPHPAAGLELELRPHAAVDDGRFGTLPWLLELPDPLARLMWDNALRLSPRTADGLDVRTGDVVSVAAAGSPSVELPVLVVPGVAEGVGGLDLGMGRLVDGAPIGVNAWPLALPDSRVRTGVTVAKTGRKQVLAQGQLTFEMHGRVVTHSGTVQQFRDDPSCIQHERLRPEVASLYGFDYPGPKWEAAIDLHRCTGCGACVVACQAENNIPPVGKEECANGRRLHWMRIDLYREGDPDDPTLQFSPMACQHCDQAPCEYVCPVNATAHSHEGLNEQVYNRCIGTRYCMNNCPYKVRRFNFYRYTERFLRDPVQKLMTNPDVTVRGIGVMEKCTFCLQRVNAARFRAANEGRPVRDGEVVLACQQACPSGAIRFGDATRRKGELAEVVRWKDSPRAFHVLEELNIGPNVTYLARLRNPSVPPHGGRG